MQRGIDLLSWNQIPIDEDSLELRTLDLRDSETAQSASLAELIPILASPDDRAALTLSANGIASASGQLYPLIDQSPLLLPQQVISRIHNSTLDISFDNIKDALDQYLYLNIVKNSGWEANSPHDDVWYLRHLHRSRQLVANSKGLVLDIGCDEPEISRRIFPAEARYVGLEPSLEQRQGMRLIGMAEFLPFQNEGVDAVSFMTSLDHILDYHTAIDEAYRVLRPGGSLYLVTLIWADRAHLYRDSIHFHHFRDFEIAGALRNFHIKSMKRYNWKNDSHRSVYYLEAVKPV